MNVPGTGMHPKPWFAIWTRPGEAWPAIVHDPYDPRTLLLGALPGISALLLLLSLIELFSFPLIIALSVLLGSLLGLITIHLLSIFLTWSGRWFGGNHDHAAHRAVAAWSCMPMSASIVLIPIFVVMIKTMPTGRQDAVLIAALLSLAALAIWSLVLLFKGVRAINGSSSSRAAAHAGIAALMTIIVLAVVTATLAVVLALGYRQTAGYFYQTGVLVGGK